MSNQHTPGLPWSLKATDAKTVLWRIVDATGRVVASIPRPFKGVDQADAEAARIVQCVNACAGVPSEVLEARAAGGLPWSVADQLERELMLDNFEGWLRRNGNGWIADELEVRRAKATGES